MHIVAFDTGGSATQNILHRIQRAGIAAVLVAVGFACEPAGGWCTASLLGAAGLAWGSRLLRAASAVGTLGPRFRLALPGRTMNGNVLALVVSVPVVPFHSEAAPAIAVRGPQERSCRAWVLAQEGAAHE